MTASRVSRGALPSRDLPGDGQTGVVKRSEGETPALAEKVCFLKRPASYPDGPMRVEAIETHMSWVFLTDHHA